MQLLRADLLAGLTVEQALDIYTRIERASEVVVPARILLAGRLQSESD